VTCDGREHGFSLMREDVNNSRIEFLKIARNNLNVRIAMLEGN